MELLTGVPIDRETALGVVDPYLVLLDSVLRQGWQSLQALSAAAPAEMGAAGPAAKGMLVADLLSGPVHRTFGSLPGAVVDDRYGRPWVNLAGGSVQIRFRKLRRDLSICAGDSDRQDMLSFHLGDPCLPDMPAATILTAGYVLNPAGEDIENSFLVCHLGAFVHYSVPLTGSETKLTNSVQLPLTPLSAPIIRSARHAARERLGDSAS